MAGMNKNAIKKAVLKMIAEEFKLPEKKIGENPSFQKNMGSDSLRMLYFIQKIEDKFEIRFDDEILRNFNFLSDIIDHIVKEMEKKKCLTAQV